MRRFGLRRQHRLIGVLLLAPFVVWSLTGIFFLVRPGYQEAYEGVPVRRYALPEELRIPTRAEWREVRTLRSVLGDHLLVRTESGWRHLRAATAEEWPPPDEPDLIRLLEDAFSFRPERYGRVASVDGNTALTDTGVELTVDWSTLSIRQNGRDTRWIDRIYAAHYLRWTGIGAVDVVLGVGGLILLLYMTGTGAAMVFATRRGRRRDASPRDR